MSYGGPVQVRATIELRSTRPSKVPALRRQHDFAPVKSRGPAKSLRKCVACLAVVQGPQPPYLVCRRCLVPVHASCLGPDAASTESWCDDERGSRGAAVAIVDNLDVALLEKLARFDTLEASSGVTIPVDEAKRELDALVSTGLLLAAEAPPDTANHVRVDERPAIVAFAEGLRDRILSTRI